MLHLAISAGVPDAGVLTLEGLRCGAQARASRQNRTELNKRNRDERATTHTATTVSNGETVKRQGSDIARNTQWMVSKSEQAQQQQYLITTQPTISHFRQNYVELAAILVLGEGRARHP